MGHIYGPLVDKFGFYIISHHHNKSWQAQISRPLAARLGYHIITSKQKTTSEEHYLEHRFTLARLKLGLVVEANKLCLIFNYLVAKLYHNLCV